MNFQENRDFSDFLAFHDFSNFSDSEIVFNVNFYVRYNILCLDIFLSHFFGILHDLCKKFEEKCQNFEISRKYSMARSEKSLKSNLEVAPCVAVAEIETKFNCII